MSANYRDLLKYAATGIASPSMTYYDKMRASTLMGGAVQTLTGIPPLSFNSNGKPLISWSMLGNGQQTGTPAPDNPVIPEFVGVKTANLWDEDYTGISASLKYVPVYVGDDGSFTLSTSCPAIERTAALFLLAGNVQTGASTSSNGVYKDKPITVTSISGYVTIAYRYVLYQSGTCDPRNEQTMLNSGSTALPYEPYGYKIPLTCAGQTVPVYLGQTPTVRRVKKLVLTGDESWREQYGGYVLYASKKSGANTIVCTHYPESQSTTADKVIYGNSTNVIIIYDSDYATLNEFKSYLAAQYAAGTPVTVWYVLAEPETAIVNEPLCKIGDYADELHSTDAGVSIPTAKGQNTLTVDTDLQPSEMTITYRG